MISALPQKSQRNLKIHSLLSALKAVLKNQLRRLSRCARPNARWRRAARRRQQDSRVDMADLGAVSMVSDMGQSPQRYVVNRISEFHLGKSGQLSILKATTSAPPGSSLSCRRHYFLLTSLSDYFCVASLQKRLGLTTKDADLSAVWLTQDQFGMTFLDQFGFIDTSMGDLLELSKGPLEDRREDF